MDDETKRTGAGHKKDDPKPSLEITAPDAIASLARAIVGMAPIIGPPIAELVTVGIRNQQIHRIAKFVQILDADVKHLGEEFIRVKLTDENFNDLLHEGLLQVTRALTEERRQYIASLIAKGLVEEQISASESKHLLRILGELSDVEVIVLRYLAVPTFGGDEEFRDKHKAVIKYEPAYIGAPQEVLAKAALQDSYRQHLARLGLLEPRYRRERKTDPASELTHVLRYPATTSPA